MWLTLFILDHNQVIVDEDQRGDIGVLYLSDVSQALILFLNILKEMHGGHAGHTDQHHILFNSKRNNLVFFDILRDLEAFDLL
jgi:hypothetical protein